MKKMTVRLLCLLLVMLALTGCGSKFDASGYVKAVMDNLYLDDSTAYAEIVDITADEAHTAYLDGLSTEAQAFYNYLSFDAVETGDATAERVISLYDQIYKYSRYEVGEAEETDGGYTVTVRIYPIDIFEQSMEALNEYLNGFYEKISSGEYAGRNEQELNAIYQDNILSILEGKIGSIGYLDPVDQTVQVQKDDGGVWSMSDEDFQTLDTYIISY